MKLNHKTRNLKKSATLIILIIMLTTTGFTNVSTAEEISGDINTTGVSGDANNDYNLNKSKYIGINQEYIQQNKTNTTNGGAASSQIMNNKTKEKLDIIATDGVIQSANITNRNSSNSTLQRQSTQGLDVSVETTIGSSPVTEVAPGQPVEVIVDYNLQGEPPHTIKTGDKDTTYIGSEILDTQVVNDNSGRISARVPYSALDEVRSDDLSKSVNIRAWETEGVVAVEESEEHKIGRTGSSIYLSNIPNTVPEGSPTSVLLYGWSGDSIVNWELRESDSVTNPLMAKSYITPSGNYFQQSVSFTPSNYTGNLGDPPIELFASVRDSSSQSGEYVINIGPPSDGDISVSESEMCADVQNSEPYRCTPGEVTSTFSSSDERAIMWADVGTVDESFTATWRFYGPDGNLFTTISDTVNREGDYVDGLHIWGWINIVGSDAANMPGEWTVELDVNGRVALTDTFTIQPADEQDLQVDIRQITRQDFPEVEVFATVGDENGKSIDGIASDDISITEDRTVQSVSSVEAINSTGGSEISAALVIDRSSSMEDGTPSKLSQAEDAARQFIGTLEAGDEGAIISFADDTRIDQRWTESYPELDNEIDFRAGGNTELYGSIIEAVEQATPRSGRSAVIVLTDGQPNLDSATQTQAIETAQRENVPVYTIGLGSDVDGNQLQQVARETGGTYYFAPSASDLDQIYQDISQQINNEYQITYETSNTATNGQTRLVNITAFSNGQIGSDSGQYTAPCAPLPTAEFSVTQTGDQIEVDASGSQANGGSFVEYRWDFTNDGQTDTTGVEATHTYNNSGTYEMKLTVEKECGVVDSQIQTIEIQSSGTDTHVYRLPFTRNTQELGSSLNSQLRITARESNTSVWVDHDADGTAEAMPTLGTRETVSYSQPAAGSVIRTNAPADVTYRYASADYGAYEDDNQRYGVPEQSLLGTEYYLPIDADRLSVAATAATEVRIDIDGDGAIDRTRSLGANDTMTTSGVNSGAYVSADAPVNVVAERSNWQNKDNTYLVSLLPAATANQTYHVPAEPDYSRQSPESRTAVFVAGTTNGTTVTVDRSRDGSVDTRVTLDAGETDRFPTTSATTVSADAPIIAVYSYHVIANDSWTSDRRDYIGVATPVPSIEFNQDSWSGTSESVAAWSSYAITPSAGSEDPSDEPPSESVGVELRPDTATAPPSGTHTIDVVATNVSEGIGSYDMTVALNDNSVATVSGITLNGNPIQGGNTTIAKDGSQVEFSGAATNMDDTGAVTMATITLQTETQGSVATSTTVEALGNESGAPVSVTGVSEATVTVTEEPQLPAVVGDAPPTDQNSDGTYEDVNGDGTFGVNDVTALWANRNSDAIQNNPWAFDMNGDGSFNVNDVTALWQAY